MYVIVNRQLSNKLSANQNHLGLRYQLIEVNRFLAFVQLNRLAFNWSQAQVLYVYKSNIYILYDNHGYFTKPTCKTKRLRQETVERRVIEGQSFLKTRASHPLKFIPLQPSCDTYKYSFWPRTIIVWNSLPSDYLTLDSTAKFKATVSDYIFFSVMFTPFDLLYFLLVVVLSFLVRSLRICLL